LLLTLLVVPFTIALVGFVISKQVSWKEFLLQVGIQVVVIGLGYWIAIAARTRDVELWNGQIDRKWTGDETCCHDYCCAWTTCCSGSGKNESCTSCCAMYCKEHGHDVYWKATTNLGETVYSNSCNPPYRSTPQRWAEIVVGEPTASQRGYTNYIKGNPDSILRRQGIEERFPGLMPRYPDVYDIYRAHRLIPVGVAIVDYQALDQRLSDINGRLGPLREVNVIVVVTKVADEMYLEALREHWLGGKKNDFVLVVGTPNYPQIAWAGVLSWTKREDLKVDVRNAVLDLKTFDGRALDIIEHEINTKFQRRPMKDFEYLASTVEPSKTMSIVLFFLGLNLAIGLKIWCVKRDVFGDEPAEPRTWRPIQLPRRWRS
jgi:hypothetical protein